MFRLSFKELNALFGWLVLILLWFSAQHLSGLAVSFFVPNERVFGIIPRLIHSAMMVFMILTPLLLLYFKKTKNFGLPKGLFDGTPFPAQLFLWTLILWGLLSWALLLVLKLFHGNSWTWSYSGSLWWYSFFYWLLTMPFQTLFEELVFRYWLNAAISQLTKKQGWSIFLTALIFALLHTGNSEFNAHPWLGIFMYYVLNGLFLGYCFYQSGSLVVSWAIHLIHNLCVVTGVQYPEASIQGSTLWHASASESIIIVGLVTIFQMLLFIVVFNSKRFKLYYEPVKI